MPLLMTFLLAFFLAPVVHAITFSTVATTGDAATGDWKYQGAAAIGTSVYFAPFVQNNVGIFNVPLSRIHL